MSTDRPVILILGTTASGKTSLSLSLAERLPGGGEIVSADSMQVYRGMDIGTAKPTEAERRGIPHHGFDVADPSDDGFTVDSWHDLAEAAIEEIRGRGPWPIVVGGTFLYAKALLFGLDFGPASDPAVRTRLQALDRAERRRRLLEIDPETAERLHERDDRRTVRALEVHELTGQPLSELQRTWAVSRMREDVRMIVLEWPVDAINRRINARVRAMMEDGLLDEVERLLAGPGLGEQARQALAYRQLADWIDAGRPGGDRGLAETVEQIKIRTRRYGKQQRTWLRRFRTYPRTLFLDAASVDPQAIEEKALAFAQDPSPAPTHSGAKAPSDPNEP